MSYMGFSNAVSMQHCFLSYTLDPHDELPEGEKDELKRKEKYNCIKFSIFLELQGKGSLQLQPCVTYLEICSPSL